MKRIQVALQGGGGRMGLELKKLGAGAASRANVCEFDGSPADVVVDFSSPAGLAKALRWCLRTRTPLVSGTTGLSPAQMRALKAAGRKIPVLWAPNMSLGIAVVKRMLESFHGQSEFDFQIEEIHHKRKVDSPSGTAKALQFKLHEVTGRNLPPISSIRGGGVFGVHRIFAMAEEETITLEHSALSRAVFARGALAAAMWIVRQRPGNYSIEDVLFKRKGRAR